MLRFFGFAAIVSAMLCSAALEAHAQGGKPAADGGGSAVAAPAASPEAAPAAAAAPAPVAEPAAAPSVAPAPTEPVPAQAPAAPAVSIMPPSAATSGRAACLLGPSSSVPSADAMTATGLVCEALLQSGAHIDATPTSEADTQASSGYRVSLQPLGKILLLKVAFESPIGVVSDSRTLQLSSIEEVPVAAGRVADSLLKGRPLEETAKMNTLVGEETRTYKKKHGELSIGAGVFGFGAVNSDVIAGYGLYGQLFYEVLRYGLGAEIRVGGSDFDSGDATLTSVGLTGRYFFSDGDITPFLGGGFGVLWFSDRNDERTPAPNASSGYYYYDDFERFEGSGLAAHVDVGVEMLRMHDVRFDAHLRVDVPTFVLTELGENNPDRYVLPISIMGSFSFQ